MRYKKYLSAICLSLVLTSIAYSQTISEENAPLNIVGMHYSQFPNAKSTTWQKTYSGGVYSMMASFVFKKEKHIVKYNMNGKKIEEHVVINQNKLYPSIFTELELKHGKFKITSFTKNSYFNNGKVVNQFYTLSLKTKSSLIDEFLNMDMELGSKPKNLFASINK